MLVAFVDGEGAFVGEAPDTQVVIDIEEGIS